MIKSKFFIVIAACILVSSFSITVIASRFIQKPEVKSVNIKPLPTPTPTFLNSYKIYDLINDYRASNNLKKLVFDPSMCDFAKIRLEQIHTDWSHNGFLPAAKEAYGYNAYIGENLAKNYFSEEETLSNWIASPEHLENIEKTVYTRTCIETDNFQNRTYVVQEFANY